MQSPDTELINLPASASRLGPLLELKRSVSATGEISGYASTFNGAPDFHGDVVAPGAFTRTLAEHRGRKTAPAMLWAHDLAEVTGAWFDLREDQYGLKASGKLTLETRRGSEAHALVKDGALALSIGFRPRDSRQERGYRVLTDIELFEISLVAIPANSSARITDVKSAGGADDITTPREFEEFLREAGFPRTFAKAVTAHGFKTAAGLCDADSEAVAELVRATKARTKLLTRILKGNHHGRHY